MPNLNLKTKYKIITELNAGARVTDMANKYNLAKSTVSTLKSMEAEILRRYDPRGDTYGTRKKMRRSDNPKMEQALIEWMLEQEADGKEVMRRDIRKQAIKLHEQLRENDRPFYASEGWVLRFKLRYNMLPAKQELVRKKLTKDNQLESEQDVKIESPDNEDSNDNLLQALNVTNEYSADESTARSEDMLEIKEEPLDILFDIEDKYHKTDAQIQQSNKNNQDVTLNDEPGPDVWNEAIETESDLTQNNEVENFKYSSIKQKIDLGYYKIKPKVGKSAVWNIFTLIETEEGKELENIVYCTICKRVYSHKRRTTSNLVKHECCRMLKIKRPAVETNMLRDETVNRSLNTSPKSIIEAANETIEQQPENIVHDSQWQANSFIKDKIEKGFYKVKNKNGRSDVWEYYAVIENEQGVELENLVMCNSCKNIYKYTTKSTSNLVKHSCYVRAKVIKEKLNIKTDVSLDEKHDCLKLFSKWMIGSGRSLSIAEDPGLKQIVQYILNIGAKYAGTTDVNKLLPTQSDLTLTIQQLYDRNLNKLKDEIQQFKNIGYAITCDLWTNKQCGQTVLVLLIHYIKHGELNKKLLGVEMLRNNKPTAANIKLMAEKLLANFELELNEHCIFVTDMNKNITETITSHNKIFCIKQLLNKSVEISLCNETKFDEIFTTCSELLTYIETFDANLLTKTTPAELCSLCNGEFYALYVINENLSKIIKFLQEKNQLNRLNNIDSNLISGLANILLQFEETCRKLADGNQAKINLAYIHIHRLKKLCLPKCEDFEVIKMLKNKLIATLDNLLELKNTSMILKIALFLFPPANKLLQFNDEEKIAIKNECKRFLMESFVDEPQEQKNLEISAQAELFSDFIQPIAKRDSSQCISVELFAYASMDVPFHDDFNVLHWWSEHRLQYPLLYKLSCLILSTPASISSAEEIFTLLHGLITNNSFTNSQNCENINRIIFLNYN